MLQNKKYLFHLIDSSPWPLFSSVGSFFFTMFIILTTEFVFLSYLNNFNNLTKDYLYGLSQLKNKQKKNVLIVKRFYSSNFNQNPKNNNKFKHYIKNIDKIIYKILNILFLKRVVTTLFFILTFIMLYINFDIKNILFIIYIVYYLIYWLFLRFLKLKFYKYKDTSQNRFFYKNLSIFILNISLLFSIVLFSNIEDISENYVFLENIHFLGDYFFFYLICLIFILFFMIVSTFSLCEKVDVDYNIKFLEEIQWKEFVIKTDFLLDYSFINKYIKRYYIDLLVFWYKKIQIIFFLSILLNLFTNLSTIIFFKLFFIIILYIYLFFIILLFPIFFEILILYIINIPNCFIYSKHIEDDENIKYIKGWWWSDFNFTKLIKNFTHLDTSVKKVHNLGIWSVFGALSGIYICYNAWYQYSYPDLKSPYERHNDLYIKPFMKKKFNIPSDLELESNDYDPETLKKKDKYQD